MKSGEDAITRWFAGQRTLDKSQFPIAIGDDMAEVALADGVTVLITTDMLMEGVHFELDSASLRQVGYKAMAVNLSDCAAMATVPAGAVATVGLPEGYGEKQLKELYEGLCEAGDKYNCPVIGGDICRYKKDGSLVVNVTMLSRRAGHSPVRRDGAREGDAICVTGHLGGGAAKHLVFEPRVSEAIRIARMVKLHSMIDISDGLSVDLRRICEKSGVGAIIEADSIPISQAANDKDKPLEAALNDGEDFELLFTLAESEYENLAEKWHCGVLVTKIGTTTKDKTVMIRYKNGDTEQLQAKGYDHLI